MTEEKIVNRIKKMMALANDPSASDGERENALRMSYNLLAVRVQDSRATYGKASLLAQVEELEALLAKARAAVEAI